jgi:hypothetical protein
MVQALTDLPPIIPAAVQVLFPADSSTTLFKPPYAITVTLASIQIAINGQLPQGILGFDNVWSVNASATEILETTITAVYSGTDTTPTNLSFLVTCANQIAADWYLWQLAKVEVTLAGICNWIPEGASDAIEWTHSGTDVAGTVSTRITRAEAHTYAELPPFTPIAGILDINSFRNLATGYGPSVSENDFGTNNLRGVYPFSSLTGACYDSLFAMPFVSTLGGILERLQVWVTQLAAMGGGNLAKLRIGIFDSQDPKHNNPRNLIYLSADLDVSTTGPYSVGTWVGETGLNVVLNPSTLYWFALQCSFLASSAVSPITLRTSGTNVINFLGFSDPGWNNSNSTFNAPWQKQGEYPPGSRLNSTTGCFWYNIRHAIVSVSPTNPIVIGANGHGLGNGDEAGINYCDPFFAANGAWTISNVTPNSFTIPVDGTVGGLGYGAYAGGGTWAPVSTGVLNYMSAFPTTIDPNFWTPIAQGQDSSLGSEMPLFRAEFIA